MSICRQSNKKCVNLRTPTSIKHLTKPTYTAIFQHITKLSQSNKIQLLTKVKICEEIENLTSQKSKCDHKWALLHQKTSKNTGLSTNTHKITASKIKKYQFITSLSIVKP